MKGGPTTKIKHIITIKKKIRPRGGLGAHLGPSLHRRNDFRFYVSIISIEFGQFGVIDK